MQNKFLRFLFGKFILGSRKFWRIARFEEKHKIQEKIQKFFKVYQKTESVVQDVAIPIENCVSFLDFFNKNIGILPIWICPTKAFDKKAKYPLFDLDPNKLFVDFGFWDTVKSNKQDGYYNKLIEDKVEKLKGHKSLYSTSFYNKDNFWQIYSYDHYKKIKSKYDPKNIKKDLYTKCVLNK